MYKFKYRQFLLDYMSLCNSTVGSLNSNFLLILFSHQEKEALLLKIYKKKLNIKKFNAVFAVGIEGHFYKKKVLY